MTSLLEDPDRARTALWQMMRIRRFEERAEEQYTRARIGGYCHLAIGEEAANVGAIAALREHDVLFSSYRDHAAALAVGSSMPAVMSELFGKVDGVAGGYGGSMHLLDVERNFYGGWGIVGGQLPIAVGAALALDYQDSYGVVLCQLGDGATNTGAFHEALNLAAIWQLPIVFQVLNNFYGMGTPVEQASAEAEIWRRASAYRIEGERVDGNDLDAVYAATCRACDRARLERLPTLLECVTYRWRGHSIADAGKSYRSEAEIAEWRERDPIGLYAARLRGAGLLDADQEQQLWRRAEQEVADAIAFAEASPDPDPTALAEHVYTDPASAEQFARHQPGAPFGEREETRRWES
jgi:pyruvate dehydrogenase E1 component alpha subunit